MSLPAPENFVKAISLHQPWASLMVLSSAYRKLFETRSWDTSYRGVLLIHASRKITKLALELSHREPFRSALKEDPYWLAMRGHVLGAVNLKATHFLKSGVAEQILAGHPWERDFGDFRNGRYAWECPNAIRFKEPFSVAGRQRIFQVPAQSVWLATEDWEECPEWWGDAANCPGCFCWNCRSYGD